MKTIKLKNATLELSAEDIAELRKQLEEEATDWPQEGEEYYTYDRWNKESAKVEWRNSIAGFVMERNGIERPDIEFKSEVIGNIYENPELLTPQNG